MRKTISLLVLISLPLIMGAGESVTLTNTPNPDGAKQRLKGSGTYTLSGGDTFINVTYTVTVWQSNPPQTTQSYDNTGGGTWAKTLSVAAGTYNPTQATLVWSSGGQVHNVQNTNTTDNVVVN
jgi:hypothetical protein